MKEQLILVHITSNNIIAPTQCEGLLADSNLLKYIQTICDCDREL